MMTSFAIGSREVPLALEIYRGVDDRQAGPKDHDPTPETCCLTPDATRDTGAPGVAPVERP